MANIELARAYVTIVPSMEGAQQAITEGLTGASVEAGSSAGSQAGSSFGTSFGGVLRTTGAIVAGVTGAMATGIAAGTGALVSFTSSGAAYADEVLTMSTNTHIATDELQAYMYAAELVDVSTETMTSSMARNIRSMNSAAEGTGEVAEAYEALGLSVTDADGNLRDSQEVYWEAIDALGEIDDATQRDALSMTLFGRGAQDLNSLIEVGSEGMAEYAAQAEEAGAILSEDTLQQFGEFDDVMQQVGGGVDAAKNALGTVLLPVLTELGTEGTGLLGEFTTGILAANGDMGMIAQTIEGLLPQVAGLINEFLPTIISLGGSVISTLITVLLGNLGLILSTAGELLMALCTGILQQLPSLIPVAIDLVMELVNFILDANNLSMIINAAIQIVLAVANGLAENLATLIPSVVSAILTICETLTNPDMIVQLVDAALHIIIALGEGLVMAIPTLIEQIPTILVNIIEAFAQLGPMLLSEAAEWGGDLIEGLVSGISNGISYVQDAVAGVAQGIRDFIGFSEPEKGPLSNFHTYMPDMFDLLTEGVEDGTPEFEATLNRTLSMPTLGGTAAIAEGYGSFGGGSEMMTPVNIFIGQEKLDTIMLRSSQNATYRRGG